MASMSAREATACTGSHYQSHGNGSPCFNAPVSRRRAYARRVHCPCPFASPQAQTTSTLPSPCPQPAQPVNMQCIAWHDNPALAERCIASIASALERDPTTSFYCRQGMEQQLYTALLRLTLRTNPHTTNILSVADGACAAVCFPLPRMETLDLLSLLSCLGDMWALMTALRPERWIDGLLGADSLEDRRNAFLREHGGRALYLLTIGTTPDRQGQGLGSAVMQVMTDLADRLQVPMYLEASSPRSTALYARHGFQEISTESPKPGAPPLTFMWRRAPLDAPLESSTDGPASDLPRGPGLGVSQEAAEAGLGAGVQGQAVSKGLFSQHPMAAGAQAKGRQSPTPES